MIKHAIIDGFKNLYRSFWMSVTACSVLSVSFLSVALIACTSSFFAYAIRQFDQELVINVYFKDGTNDDIIKLMQEEIQAIETVRKVDYVSQEEARERTLSNNLADASLIESIDADDTNAFFKSIEIFPTAAEDYENIISRVQSPRYVDIIDSISEDREFSRVLENLYFATNIIIILGVLFFGAISILVMINILRMVIYTSKEEIEIMRLVGATNSYIRGPFIVQGMYFILFASIVVLLFTIPIFQIVIPFLGRLVNLQIDNIWNSSLTLQFYIPIFATIIVGFIVGIITSTLATQRYLKF